MGRSRTMSTEQNDSPNFDPSQRRLCPDGACTGVIGDNGKCKECGTSDPGWTGATPGAGSAASSCPEPAVDDEAGLDSEADSAGEEEAGAEGSFDPHRRLCSHGECIGVLDSKNHCKVCGRPG